MKIIPKRVVRTKFDIYVFIHNYYVKSLVIDNIWQTFAYISWLKNPLHLFLQEMTHEI